MDYGISGALLLELSLNEAIKFEAGRIRPLPVADARKWSPVLDLAFGKKHELGIREFVLSMTKKAPEIRKNAIERLVSEGILEKVEGKVLWIFNTEKYPTKDDRPEQELRTRLMGIARGEIEASKREVMLLSLIQNCGLQREVFGREQSKEERKRIAKIIDEFNLGKAFTNMIQEINEEMAAVMVAITVNS